jgi:hypothetical protein
MGGCLTFWVVVGGYRSGVINRRSLATELSSRPPSQIGSIFKGRSRGGKRARVERSYGNMHPAFFRIRCILRFCIGENYDIAELLGITGLIAYIIFWLWMQRVFFSFVQLQITSFDLLKTMLHVVPFFVGLSFLYFGRFALSLVSPAPVLVLAIFIVDFVAQIILLLLWRRGGKVGSGPSVV